jgi:outer membrane receptor protein involved in Fe transport
MDAHMFRIRRNGRCKPTLIMSNRTPDSGLNISIRMTSICRTASLSALGTISCGELAIAIRPWRIPRAFELTWTPETQHIRLFNIFGQDDITVVPDRLHLILGNKFEDNSLVQWEVEPNGRLLWTPAENQSVWAAVSRAARTPSLFELDTDN